jgi:hypothetical protein
MLQIKIFLKYVIQKQNTIYIIQNHYKFHSLILLFFMLLLKFSDVSIYVVSTLTFVHWI